MSLLIAHFLGGLLVKQILVVFEVKRLLNGPLAEFLEQNLTFSISVNFSKLRVRVLYFTDPFLDHLNCSFELFFVNSLVIAYVDFIESLEVFKSLSESN